MLTRHKAREILSDGSVRGQALTPKQRRFMGAVAGGRVRKRQAVRNVRALTGKYESPY